MEITARIHKALDSWQSEISHPNTSKLFIRVLNFLGFMLFVWMLPIADNIWGTENFMIVQNEFSGLNRYAYLLREEAFRAHYQWFLYPFLMITLVAALGFTNVVLRLITWLLFVNLRFAVFEIGNGGFHLLHYLFLLSVLLFEVPKEKTNRLSSALRLIHNVAFGFIWIQISILYLSSGIHKLLGSYWLNGDAVAITLMIDEFTLPSIKSQITHSTLFLKFLTWGGLGYQLAFPVFIWFKKLRPALLAVGLLFHLVIAFVIGVTDFGFILIAAYSIFIPERISARIVQRIEFKRFLS